MGDVCSFFNIWGFFIDIFVQIILVPLATEYVDPKEGLDFVKPNKEFKIIKAPLQETWREL